MRSLLTSIGYSRECTASKGGAMAEIIVILVLYIIKRGLFDSLNDQ